MSHAQEALLAVPSAVTALSGAEASGAASHSSEGNGPHSFGGQVSPRAARSQISTAVSFEGARAAGSAALPSRSLEEESALSAAEGDVECSHSADPNQAARGGFRPARGVRLPRPSNSLISTAVQPASPRGHAHQPVSPKLTRANSVVSHTAPGARAHGGRAGTPASVYGQGQGFLLPSRARQQSPAQGLPAEQVDQQTAAAATAAQDQSNHMQLPPAWQNMPPAFPALQEMHGAAASQQPVMPHQQHHLYSALHRPEGRDMYNGHNRSSDNGSGRQLVNLQYAAAAPVSALARPQQQHQQGSIAEETTPAEDVAADAPAGGAAEFARMAAAAGPSSLASVPQLPTAQQQQRQPQQQQHSAGLLQSNMQFFQNLLTDLPAAAAGGLLHSLLGLSNSAGRHMSQGQGIPFNPHMGGSASAPFAHASQAPPGAILHDSGAAAAAAGNPPDRQQNMAPAADSAVGLSANLMQQLSVQMTPALLAVLQGQGPASVQGDAHSLQQQLQQALSLLLAGLASQAEQYRLAMPSSAHPGLAEQQSLQQPYTGALAEATGLGMLPPPAPPSQAKSCDSSMPGPQGNPMVASAAGQPHGTVLPPDSVCLRCLPPEAAAAAMQAGVQQAGPSHRRDVAAGSQPLQQHALPRWEEQQQQAQRGGRQQLGLQHTHWRSPSPSPVPVGHAAARTSTAGEGHGSLHLGNQGVWYSQPQHPVDTAAAAISSGGGVSRAGGGFISEEGEAEAVPGTADPGAAAVDDAGQQASIGEATPALDCLQAHHQQQLFEQQQHSHRHQANDHHVNHLDQQCVVRDLASIDRARAGQLASSQHFQQQQPRDQQLSSPPGDVVQQAASVHATMISEGNEMEGSADSEQSSTHSGNSNSHMGGAEVGRHRNAEAEIVSQPCGASHSASPPPSESMPAAATATGPMSRSTAGEHEPGTAGNVAAAAAGLGVDAGGSARPADAGVNGLLVDFMLPPGQSVSSGHRSNQHASKHKQQDGQHCQQNRRDSSIAMATAGPTGTHSATISNNSGSVDMSIRNQSQRSGAGSQGAAAVVANGGWAEDDADDEMQGAANSRDGEARGEPPGACETAESGRAADVGYQLHQHLQHEHQQEHVPAASPVPGYSAAALSPVCMGEASAQADSGMMGGAQAATARGRNPLYTGQEVPDGHTQHQHQHRESRPQQHSVRFATASAPGDVYGHVGSPALQGGYSSSDVGIPGVSAIGHGTAVPRRESSAAGNVPTDEQGAVDTFGNNQSVSAIGVDAGSTMVEAAVGTAQGDHPQMPANMSRPEEATVADNEPPQPTLAQHIEQVPLGATLSVTSQLQPIGQQQQLAGAAAAVGAGHTQQRQVSPQYQHFQQQPGQNGGSHLGTNAGMAPVVSLMTTASQVQAGFFGTHAVPAADAVPQVTEIHGYFAGHAVPATAAAAQMAAAAAAQHAHVNSDVQPQVTEMHGVFGASAGTAAEAQLAAAAAGHGHAHDFGGPAAAAASGAAGATGSTIGDGRLPPLPHVHSSRGYPAVQQRTANAAAAAAAGTSRVGQTAGGSPGMAMTPLVAGYHGVSRIGSTRNMQAPRSASAEAPQAAVHGRASHSPPAVNFDPVEQAITVESGAAGQLAEGNGHVMPEAGASLPIHQQQEHYDCSTLHTRAADARPADDAVADYDRALPCGSEPVSHQHSEQQQQQQYPASPGDAQIQGNSQLGQQDGSRGSPPLGMGRVGSVPPQNPGRANGGEAGVVEQQSPLCARRTLDEDAGSHHQVVDEGQQLQPIEQEADGPLHAPERQLQQQAAESKSGATSPSQQQRCRHLPGGAAAADCVASRRHHPVMSQQRSEQAQQHWQQLQGAVHEGAGQVGGRAASMRFSYGQADGSAAAGISSKIYGSVSAGFASGSKAEGSPSCGVALDGCSYGDAMASGANGFHADRAQQRTADLQADNELDPQQQGNMPSTSRRRPRSGGMPAAAASVGMLQEGEGSHGSKSQEARSCKRHRTSCEAASVPQHMTSSMQTTEA